MLKVMNMMLRCEMVRNGLKDCVGERNYDEWREGEGRKGKFGEFEMVRVWGSGVVVVGLDKEYKFDVWNGDVV